MMDFNEARDAYVNARSEERMKIIKFLEQKGFEILKKNGGSGRANYKGSHMETPHNLRNWKWIEAQCGENYYFISLQVFEQDYKSKNRHILMDRLGVYKHMEYDPEAIFESMQITEIELPMTEEKLENLLTYLH
ncbi:MAG: hypothetical protein IJY09_08500 [Lachnospiraceae bacterium]|nr:hypothetical protein [Lachnospiraceae bacterium]